MCASMALGALLILAFAISIPCRVMYSSPRLLLVLREGHLGYLYSSRPAFWRKPSGWSVDLITPDWSRLPSRWEFEKFDHGYSGAVPLWLPLAVVIAITFAFARFLRSRPMSNCCRDCGYDLTGNVSGVCPECGTAIPAEQKARAVPEQAQNVDPPPTHPRDRDNGKGD